MSELALVVDDNPLLLATLGEALSADDIAPVLATARDAMRHLEDGMSPDVIVIDLDMRDGCAVLARLECAISDTIPVVALSSRPQRLLEAGVADAVVMKPFEVGRLCSCVHHACDRSRGAL
jgi:DNA-binding response OmpR family regulator